MSRRDPRIWRRNPSGIAVPVPVPLTIPGIFAWWRADRGITLNGSTVSAWSDASGSGDANRTLTQATGANQPTFNASNAAYNNKPTVTFGAGVNQSLASGTFSASLTQPFTAFVVGNAKDTTTNYWYFSGTTNRVEILQFTANGAAIFAGNAFQSSFVQTASPSFMCGIFNGASSSLAVNARTAAVTGNAGASAEPDLIMGNVQGLGSPLQGPIAEIALYTGVLSAGNIDKFATYVTATYGIAVGA